MSEHDESGFYSDLALYFLFKGKIIYMHRNLDDLIFARTKSQLQYTNQMEKDKCSCKQITNGNKFRKQIENNSTLYI